MIEVPCDECEAKPTCNFIGASHCIKLFEWQKEEEQQKGLYTTKDNEELCKEKKTK